MCKGHLFALPAGAGVSPSFLLEEAGRWHKHELGRGSGRAGSSAMVSIRVCRGTKVFRGMHPESQNPQVKSASEGLFTGIIWNVFYNGAISQAGSCPLCLHRQPQPFPAQAGCWGRLCQVLAEAQEELQECAKYQAVPLALVAAFLPVPYHDKFPAFVTAANTTRLCNEGHCPRVPSRCPGTRYHRIIEP